MDSKQKLPTAEKAEQTYLAETEDGFLLSVPESKLEKMREKMRETSGEISPSFKEQLVDRLVQMLSE